MSLRLTTAALLLVALCHVAAEPAWAEPLPKSATVPVVEQAQAQLHRENLAPGNGVMGPRNYNDESVAAEEEPAWADTPLPRSTSTTVPVVEQAQLQNGVTGPRNYNDDESGLADGIIRANVIQDSFDLARSTKKTYMAFMSDLDYHVNSTGARWLNHHPVLVEQQLRDAPPTWFNLTVVGRDDDMVCFYMRSDNLYISGFTNKNGQLFSFKPQGRQYRMPGSIVLKFGGGYPDLLGSMGSRGLLDVKINKDLALTHLNTLANVQVGSTAEELLKVPAAFFVLIIAEAERFAPLRDAVFRRWEEDMPTSIDDTLPYPLPNPPYPPYQKNYLIDLVVSWRTFSCAILSWDRHGQTYGSWRGNDEAKEIRTFGVQTAQDAFSKINPILQPAEWKCIWTP